MACSHTHSVKTGYVCRLHETSYGRYLTPQPHVSRVIIMLGQSRTPKAFYSLVLTETSRTLRRRSPESSIYTPHTHTHTYIWVMCWGSRLLDLPRVLSSTNCIPRAKGLSCSSTDLQHRQTDRRLVSTIHPFIHSYNADDIQQRVQITLQPIYIYISCGNNRYILFIQCVTTQAMFRKTIKITLLYSYTVST